MAQAPKTGSGQKTSGTPPSPHRTDPDTDVRNATEAGRKEVEAARDELRRAGDETAGRMSGLAAEARDSASRRGEEVKARASESLQDFSAAIRKAGDELSQKDQGTAARLVGEAAKSLEGFSSSLQNKRLEDVVEDVRHFGRANPTAFVLGSILAGFALGRFARSSAEPRQPEHTSGYEGASGTGPATRAAQAGYGAREPSRSVAGGTR